MKFSDKERVVEIVLRKREGASWSEDYSGDYFRDWCLKSDTNRDAYIVDDVDLLLKKIDDWKTERNVDLDGFGENDEVYIYGPEEEIKDYDSLVASLFDGGWRAEDMDDLISEYDLTDHQADIICEKLKGLENEQEGD